MNAGQSAPIRAGRVRVLEVVECGGPGGTGNQVAALCAGLDKSRFEVGLVYSVRPGGSAQDYERAAKAERSWHVPEMVREISPLDDFRAWRKLYRIFWENKPDVVHAHSSKAGFLARTAAWAAGVPRIYYSPRGYSFLQTDRSGFSRFLYRRLEAFASRIGDVVAVSPSEAALAEGLGAPRIRLIANAYLGAIPSAKTEDASKKGLLICACGRLTFARRPEAFVRLAQRLTDSRNDLRCLWIGGGELQPAIEEMIRDMNLAGKLEVTGWLAKDAVLERMRSADVFVHFSRWEGLPNSVLEAMACGLPVVASDVPGNRDLVRSGENGYLASSEVELLERTLDLIDHPDKRREFGARGQERARTEFSLDRLIRQASDLYLNGPLAA